MAVGVAEEDRIDASEQRKYVLDDDDATITKYVEKPSDDLSIPAELDEHPMTGIRNDVFADFWTDRRDDPR